MNVQHKESGVKGGINALKYLWEKAKSLGMQRAMLGAGNYMAFVEAAENNYVGILDYLWEKAKSLDMQHAMLRSDGYKAFITAVQENSIDALNYLWERAESLNMQHAMLGNDGYKAFIVAAQRDSINALERLWEKAESLNMQCAMLEADGYGAFRAAAQKGHADVLKFLWSNANELQQKRMLEANGCEAFGHMIRNPVDVSLLKEFEQHINKESAINSIQEIAVQKWKECLEIIADSGDEKMLDRMWENFISLNIRQEIDKFYQKVRQRAVEAKEPQPGPSSEYESLPKRPRIESGEEEQHSTGETSNTHGIRLDNVAITHQLRTRLPEC